MCTESIFKNTREDDPVLNICLNFVHFAKDEPIFFRALFLEDHLGSKRMQDLPFDAMLDAFEQKDETKESVLSQADQDKVKDIFTNTVKNLGMGQIELKPLLPTDHPVTITKPEFMRRMKEMQAMQGMDMGMFPDSHNVVINTNHPLIADKLVKMKSEEKKADFANYLHDLALLNQNMLKGEELSIFIARSLEFIK